MSKIGFIGLGHMGGPMASNLLKHSLELQVFDLSPQQVTLLVQAGAKAANSLDDLSQAADIIITMLPSGDHVQQICSGKDG